MATKVYKPEYPGLYYFDTFTFTTLGASGNRGPDSTKGYANAPWNPDQFSIVDGKQQWTVPATGTYNIVAAGAYGATPGRVVSGDVDLSEGQVLTMIVGQMPTPLVANVADNVTVGGGGGTFVVSDGKPLIIASGGDGGSTSNLFAPSNFSSYSYAAAISGDGNTIAGIIKTTVYIYNKINGSWIQNTQTIQLPIVEGGDRVVNIVLDYTGVTLFINYGNSNYPIQNSTNKVYKYSSVTKLWDVDGTVLLTRSSSPALYSDLSDDGNTIVISYYSSYAYIFRYSSESWTYQIISSLGLGQSLSSDANVLASSSISGQLTVFRCINGTWDSGIELGNSYPYTIPVCSISGDGNTIIAQYGYETNLTIIYKYTNGSWDSGTEISTGDLQYNAGPVDVNYDGSVLFYKWSNTKIGVYIDGTVNIVNNGAIHLKCTSNGKQFIFSDGFVFGPNAVGNTSLFTRSADSQPGSFSPFGSGSGFSGAGYLTDGQETDPFFGFLKPKAYVNGGFGNSYEYGQPGVPKEGGFGGGQTCLNLQTNISEITGFANVYPSINVHADAIALDSSGTIVIIGRAALSKATVFRYSGGQWDNGYDLSLWYSLKSSVALSGDGNTAVVGSDTGFIIFTYSDGSWNEQYRVYGGFENYFGYSLALNSTGTILFVGAPYSFFSSPYVSVYRLSESTWSWSEYLPMNIPGFGYSLSTNSDGNKVLVGVSFYNIVTDPTYGDTRAYVFTYTDDVWDSGVLLTKNTNDNGTFGSSVAMNSDGNVALVGAPGGKYATMFTYANELWTPVKTFIEDVYNFGLAVKLSDNGATQIIGSTSLVTIYKSDKTYISYGTCSILAAGGNILTFPLLDTVVFENLNAPTTTCTATTSIDHGYPYDYEVQITGTNSFNGTWLITAGSSNTFTFQAFGGPTETTGYVSGTATGISGGGGYTGSAGDGVSGATCYADESVVNFTDLGATGNTAGTVTISLIDPVPLKQTWTWDQTLTNTSPNLPFELVNWSDKLGVFQSYTGQSSDGVHWNGNFLSLVLEQTQGQPSAPFYTTYSDALNLYIGFVSRNFEFVYVTSNDGVTWTETTPVGLDPATVPIMNNGSPIIWAPELNLFACAVDYQVLTSDDGINWTERYYNEFFNSVKSFSYAPSIHTFVCTGSVDLTDTGLYSTDGITWTPWSTSYPIIYPGQHVQGEGVSVTWSPKLNIFLSCVHYGIQNEDFSEFTDITYMARSTDGQTWTTAEISNGFWNVLWGEGLDIFTAIPAVSFGNSTMYSYDGITWSTINVTLSGPIAYSPTLQIFVVADDQGFRQFISIEGIYYVDIAKYYPPLEDGPFSTWASQIGTFSKQGYVAGSISSDCVNWEKTFGTHVSSARGVVVWSRELGLYTALNYKEPDGGNQPIGSYYSYDGKTWIDTSFSVPYTPKLGVEDLPYVAWSPTLGAFSGAFYSKDGINWQQPLENCTAVGWSSFHKMFAAFYYANVYYSYDGTTWNTGNNGPGYSGVGPIACSSSGRFVSQAGIHNELPFGNEEFTPEGVIYSDDGINWISGGTAFIFSNPIWIEELSIFVASYWDRWGNTEAFSGWMSSDGINWDAIDVQPSGWSPELGRILCTGGYSQVTKTF